MRASCPSVGGHAGAASAPSAAGHAEPGLLRRSAAFKNLGLPLQPTDRQSPLVTMLKKKGKRILENADEIMAHLQAVFPWARFKSLDGKAVATMSIKEQARPLRAGQCLCPCTPMAVVLRSSWTRARTLMPGSVSEHSWRPCLSHHHMVSGHRAVLPPAHAHLLTSLSSCSPHSLASSMPAQIPGDAAVVSSAPCSL